MRRSAWWVADAGFLCVSLAIGMPAYAAEVLPTPPGAHLLQTTPVDRPMRDLLRDGYEIVSLAEGLGGATVMLRREKSWVLCTLGASGDSDSPKLYTKCEALNDG